MSRRGDVYRRAAKWLHAQPVDSCDGLCDAVDFSMHTKGFMTIVSIIIADRLTIFARTNHPDYPWWCEQWSDDLAERRECRLLALCLAAAMADTGDL